MTMAAVVHPVRFAAPLPAFFEDLLVAFRTFRQRRTDRAALARAARLGPRMLADMGLEGLVPRPVVGGWDDLRLNRPLLPLR
jgi:hypothetical protein